jgi:cation diffusion facilitator family transporter
MQNNQTESERRLLWISAFGSLAGALLGLIFSILTASQAILLDCLFGITYFIVSLFTLKVARLIHRGDDEHFPYGYVFFEPLMNGIKGVLVLGIAIYAAASAAQALFTGGREIIADLAVIYGILAVVLCAALAYVIKRGSRKHNSPLLKTDALNWVINAAISACVLVAFAGILILERNPDLGWLIPYVDPAIVIVLVLLCISVPVRMAWQALMQLLNRSPSPSLAIQLREVIAETLSEQHLTELFVRVIQPGRTRIVLAHAVLSQDQNPMSVEMMDILRTRVFVALQELHSPTIVDLLFTCDRIWGAPASMAQLNAFLARQRAILSATKRGCQGSGSGYE